MTYPSRTYRPWLLNKMGEDSNSSNASCVSLCNPLNDEITSIHPHCSTCYKYNCEASAPICSMENCEKNCGARYHSCKQDEHHLLCPNMQVQCINHQFGCPSTMLRHAQASHLETCAASVVVCSVEWGRIAKKEDDVASVVGHDLETITAFKDQKNFGKAVIPFGKYKGDLYPLHGNIGGLIDMNQRRQDFLQSGFVNNPNLNEPWPLFLNQTIEFGTQYHFCDFAKFIYWCGEEMRRDMFSWHFKNVHNDLLCGLNGWIDNHCPLEGLNCAFKERRMYPDIPTATVKYNMQMECFTVVYDTSVQEITSDNVLENLGTPAIAKNICSLPTEVLEHILDFLDPLSLSCLSLTCKRLRDICSSIFLPQKGIVSFKWEKEEDLLEVTDAGSQIWNIHWKISQTLWKFPKFFTPIKKWGYLHHNPIANHMIKCEQYERVVHTKPFNLLATHAQLPAQLCTEVNVCTEVTMECNSSGSENNESLMPCQTESSSVQCDSSAHSS